MLFVYINELEKDLASLNAVFEIFANVLHKKNIWIV
jgi:hypothetical protein